MHLYQQAALYAERGKIVPEISTLRLRRTGVIIKTLNTSQRDSKKFKFRCSI